MWRLSEGRTRGTFAVAFSFAAACGGLLQAGGAVGGSAVRAIRRDDDGLVSPRILHYEVADRARVGPQSAIVSRDGLFSVDEGAFVLRIEEPLAVRRPPGSPQHEGAIDLGLSASRATPKISYVDPPSWLDRGTDHWADLGARAVEFPHQVPWTVEWSGTYTYGYRTRLSPKEVRKSDVEFAGVAVSSRSDGQTIFLKAGSNHTSTVFSGIGALDGVQGEISIGETFRFGTVAGLRPVREDDEDGEDDGSEATGVAYMSAEIGRQKELYSATTFGILGSMYNDEPDRVAYLLEQTVDLGPNLRLRSSSELCFHVFAVEEPDDYQLSRTGVSAESPLTDQFTLRTGFDQSARPHTQAQRELLPSESDWTFERATWRYWVGGSQEIVGNVRLDGELVFTDAPDAVDDYSRRWRVSVSRPWLPLPQSRMTASVYNLEGSIGYGGSVSSHASFFDSRLTVRPSVGFRFLETVESPSDFRVTDVAINAQWRASDSLAVHTGASYVFADDAERTIFDVGVEYRW